MHLTGMMNNLFPGLLTTIISVISDHAPTSLDINLPDYNPNFTQWRFNSNLLADDLFVNAMKSNILLFFEVNDTSEVSRGTLWEAFKAYLRGQVISYSSDLRKLARARQLELLQKFRDIDSSYANRPEPSLYKKRWQLQAEFNLLTTNEAELRLLKSRRVFESGEKAGKLLAQQARAAAMSRLITSIKCSSGAVHTDQISINETFSHFY